MVTTSTVVHSLPRQTTSFIGREQEIADIIALLDNPDCQLLTLVGPGGIGKTRMAIEVGQQRQIDFTHGVCYVPLASLTAVENIAPAIAQNVGIPVSRDHPATEQILEFLQDHHLLLILDNFEHLLEGVDLIVEILNTASAIKVLVTSREVLNLQEEWVRKVGGMPFPEDAVVDDAKIYTAIQLFAERAQRVRGDFSVDDEFAPIIRICQLVEGMPLALELAASWRSLMPCAAIVDRLESGPGFLATKLHNVEPRHRSIQMVFDQSWGLLIEAERVVFARLAIFHGGFTAEAAEQVAGASLPLLAALVDKSFIRVDNAGRYDFHELLRQYATQKLAADVVVEEDTNDRHCDYYARFVGDRVYEIAYGDAQPVVVEIDNLRAAWSWAVKQRKLAEITAMTEGLSFLYPDRMGLLEESRAQFEQATAALAMGEPAGEQGIVYGLVLAAQGVAEWDLDHTEEARALMRTGLAILRRLAAPKKVLASGLVFGSIAFDDLAEKAQVVEEFVAISRQLGDQWRVAHGYNQLGFNYYFFSQYDQARSCGLQLLTIAQQIDSAILMALAHLLLGEIAMNVFDFGAARQHLEATLSLFGNSYPLRRTRCLWLMGIVDREQGRYVEAERHYRENLALIEAVGLQGSELPTAITLAGLALLAAVKGKHTEALRLSEECLAIWQGLRNLEGIAGTLVMMGYLAAERGDTEEAVRCYQEAWRNGQEAGLLALTLEVVMGFADLAARSGDQKRAVELLALGFAYEWDTHGGLERKPLYQRLRNDLEAEMDQVVYQAAWARGEKYNLETTVSQLLASHWPRDEEEVWVANQALAEPLTERELEVLALLAQGYSNRQIADELVIAVGTVKRYVYAICQKLGADNRTHAVARARELQLL